MARLHTAGTITDANNSLNVHMGVFVLAYCERDLKNKWELSLHCIVHGYCI